MDPTLSRPAVERVRSALLRAGITTEIQLQDSTARSSQEAADVLGIEIGQIAASIIFRLPNDYPVLVITSGRHRIATDLIAKHLGVTELLRADADYVKSWSGFSIGGVSPIGWESKISSRSTAFGYPEEVTVLIDESLGDYDVVWAAGGHPHAVFATTYEDLFRASGATSLKVAND
jgi:prolyl-tRNA editing enzyme YbaK/EbsC (Cys-tRNA(Pro) deacylase)